MLVCSEGAKLSNKTSNIKIDQMKATLHRFLCDKVGENFEIIIF